MNKFKFYCFKSIRHIAQPNQSSWCWAACLSDMIRGLNSESQIGKTQCNLASYYKKYQNNTSCAKSEYSDCCPNRLDDDLCNVGLKENDLVDIHKASGFSVHKLDTSILSHFEHVKQLLITNQSPIILKISINNNAHANLITGFGEANSCQYILVSDPNQRIGEKYIEFNKFRQSFTIQKAWSTKVASDNLVPDQKLNDYAAKITDFISRHIPDSFNILQNMLLYLGHNDQLFIGNSIKYINENPDDNNLKNGVFNKLKDDFEIQLNENICPADINREDTINGDILFIDEARLLREDNNLIDAINNTKQCYSYIKGYAVTIILKTTENLFGEILQAQKMRQFGGDAAQKGMINYSDSRLLVYPTAYPNNFSLPDQWQSITNLFETLREKPRAIYFNNRRAMLA